MFKKAQSATAGVILIAWDELTPVAIMQIRARSQSYGGCLCQTGHGAATDSEFQRIITTENPKAVFAEVALRELKEKAGPRIAIIVKGILTKQRAALDKVAVAVEESFSLDSGLVSFTYVVDTRAKAKDLLRLLEPSEEGVGFIAVSSKTKILPLRSEHRTTGAPRGRDLYMRAGDITLIRDNLKKLSEQQSTEMHLI